MRLPLKFPLAALRYRAGIYLPHYRFHALRKLTHGMLASRVYRRLHNEVSRLPDLDVVEVGAASGTASIAMAWAMKESGKHAKLIVVEKCERGSRDQVGTYGANLSVLEQNLQKYDAASRIRLFPQRLSPENAGEMLKLIETPEIAAFVHDADGRIDRDFQLFWPRLTEGGLIVIDDVENTFHTQQKANGAMAILGKRVLTWRFVEQFTKWGLFEPFWEHHGTVFGRKPKGASFQNFDPAWCKQTAQEVAEECDRRRAQYSTPIARS